MSRVMGENVLKTALDTIKKYNMLARGDKVIVGYSGGADSSALLFALTRLREELGLGITAVHINHGLRGAEADGDEAFCALTCARYGIDFISYKADVRAEARARRLSDEEAGRVLRYERFEDALTARGADKIAVAHNKDDNAETVVMRMLRGAGAKGLSGIPPVRGRIIRPLIDVSRAEIEGFCRQNGIEYRVDATNFQPVYNRNRIRLQLMPMLSAFNPLVADALTHMAALVSDDNALLEGLADEWLEKNAVFSDNSARLELSALAAAPLPIARRAVRAAFARVGGGVFDLSGLHVGQVLSLCKKNSGKTLYLPRNIKCIRQYNSILINNEGDAAHSYCYKLAIDRWVYLDRYGIYAYLTFDDRPEPRPYSEKKLKCCCTKAFCYDKIKNNIELELRTRKNGDRIFFKSVGGSKKIGHFFSDIKMPYDSRLTTPLLADGSDVLCIFAGGLRGKAVLSDNFKPENAENAGKKRVYLQFWEEANGGIDN